MKPLPLRVGIIGLGFGARVHLPAFQSMPGTKVIAVADAETGKAQQVASNAGISAAFDDWREVIALHNVDVVTVATPPFSQAEIVTAALSAGKHVLCEKPFGLNLAEAKTMWKAAQASGCAHAVDFEFRMESGVAVLKRQVHAGAVGSVRRIDVTWLTGGRADPALPWSWQHDVDQGGGVLLAFGSHVIDYVEWILQSRIDSVFARTNVLIGIRKDSGGRQREVTAEDSCDLLCTLSNGTVANLRFSNCYPHGVGHRIEVYGDRGRLVYTHRAPFTPDLAQVSIETDSRGLRPIGIALLPAPEGLDTRILSFRQLASLFAQAISGRPATDLPDFACGLRMHAVVESARRSLRDSREASISETESLNSGLVDGGAG